MRCPIPTAWSRSAPTSWWWRRTSPCGASSSGWCLAGGRARSHADATLIRSTRRVGRARVVVERALLLLAARLAADADEAPFPVRVRGRLRQGEDELLVRPPLLLGRLAVDD